MEPYKEQLVRDLESSFNAHCQGNWLYARIETELSAGDCLDWLNGQKEPNASYVSTADHSMRFASIGCAASWTELPQTDEFKASGMPCFCLRPFDDQRNYASQWGSFLNESYFIPAIEFHPNGRLVCNLVLPPDADSHSESARMCAIIEDLATAQPVQDPLMPSVIDRTDTPELEVWTTAVDSIIQQIHSGRLEKAVMARETVFSFADTLDSAVVLKRLIERSPGANHFLFTNTDGAAFIGATPELLYQRDGVELTSQAVAATRSRGNDELSDVRLASELLSSRKELLEHQFVADMLEKRFSPMCSHIERTPVSVLKLPRLQHLYCEIHGHVQDGTSDADLLNTLHPTPAVGGVPREDALTVLRQLETFQRGCYSAPVGVVTGDSAFVMVAIRSALITGKQLRAYAGAGIVEGSEALAEWKEVESKIGGIRGIFEA